MPRFHVYDSYNELINITDDLDEAISEAKEYFGRYEIEILLDDFGDEEETN